MTDSDGCVSCGLIQNCASCEAYNKCSILVGVYPLWISLKKLMFSWHVRRLRWRELQGRRVANLSKNNRLDKHFRKTISLWKKKELRKKIISKTRKKRTNKISMIFSSNYPISCNSFTKKIKG
jgi:hypothetical protein